MLFGTFNVWILNKQSIILSPKKYINYNQFSYDIQDNKMKNNKNKNDEEKERQRKIDKNYEEIMKNNDKKNFMTVKKIEF